MDPTKKNDRCAPGSGCCNDLDRRLFLSTVAAGATLNGLPVMAGPFDENEYRKVIPADKKLAPKWVRSLLARGKKQAYTDSQALHQIGMPVGGLFAGLMYLSGDGRLWLWDIFNEQTFGVRARRVTWQGKPLKNTYDGNNYVAPLSVQSPLQHGFSLQIGERVRPLDTRGFSQVTFDGRYPIGRVTYHDSQCPVSAHLEAFSPFIPLNLDDSSLPATVINYTLTNDSDRPVTCQIAGHLQNSVCLHHRDRAPAVQHNRIVRSQNLTWLNCRVEPDPATPKAEIKQRQDHALDKEHLPPAKGVVELYDFGTMGLGLLDEAGVGSAAVDMPVDWSKPVEHATAAMSEPLVGAVGKTLTLSPGEKQTICFVVTWHFPNLWLSWMQSSPGNYYATRFADAHAVAKYLAANFARLSDDTRQWVDTWYDSTLPYWLLDRTMANTSILASTTCYRLGDGQFYAWEGVGCCEGTCTHVWQYAQAPARIFPEIERIHRRGVDFGKALTDDGYITYRYMHNQPGPLHWHRILALDGQCGRILGVYREHQMSADDRFLRDIWPSVKRAVEHLIDKDADDDGIIKTAHHLLDHNVYGRDPFMTSLYLATLRASNKMATEMGDTEFAQRCQKIADRGAQNILQLYDGEYFFHEFDPKAEEISGWAGGCYLDQLYGQSWAHQVGLGTLFDREKQLTALRAIWKYNFAPDLGPFIREKFMRGRSLRWYAIAGEAGLVMCTWPKEPPPKKLLDNMYFFFYYNEVWTGFEHHVASQMIWESKDQADLLEKGLAIERAVHDRHDARLRNPYNEIECSDHYARAMSSYGVMIAVCGYEHHGPKGYLAFSPRLRPERFRAPFTAAGGWGALDQTREDNKQTNVVELKWGQLRLKTLAFDLPSGTTAIRVAITLGDQPVPCQYNQKGTRVTTELGEAVTLRPGGQLAVVTTW